MNAIIKTGLMTAMLTLFDYAHAAEMPKSTGDVNCSAMADTGDMRKSMGSMMTDMKVMMGATKDPVMKGRMRKMHGQMASMMANMQKMGGAMPGGENADQATPSASPPAAGDHNAHH